MSQEEKNTLINALLIEYAKQNNCLSMEKSAFSTEQLFEASMSKKIDNLKKVYDTISAEVNSKF